MTLNSDQHQDVCFSSGFSEALARWLGLQDRFMLGVSRPRITPQFMIKVLGEEYGDQDFRLFIPELRSIFNTMQIAQQETFNNWLHSNEASKYPKIKTAFRLAFDLHRAPLTTQQPADQQRTANFELTLKRPTQNSPDSFFKEILDFVTDESVSIQARSRVAVCLTKYAGLSTEGVTACSRVIAKSYDAGQRFDHDQNELISNALQQSGGAEESKKP